jgi:UDP-glucose 4-epimerase
MKDQMTEVRELLDEIDRVKAENDQLESEIKYRTVQQNRESKSVSTKKMTVLVTGATGYIGSHAVRDLLNAGHTVVGIDNFSSSMRTALPITQSLPGAAERFMFEECSTGDCETVCALIQKHSIDSVIHFAAFANLRESLASPAEVCKYYANNTAQVGSEFWCLMFWHVISSIVLPSGHCTFPPRVGRWTFARY